MNSYEKTNKLKGYVNPELEVVALEKKDLIVTSVALMSCGCGEDGIEEEE